MNEVTRESTDQDRVPVESPGYVWLLATFLLIAMIFLPILMA
ncbi:MAG: hypothetical protein VCB26_04670 [Candidatus Hydrogenedentota bacterium]